MTCYIATFHTHFAAMSTFRTMKDAGIEAEMCPVPRVLSADCGTCVRYHADDACQSMLHADYDRVVAAEENGEYRQIAQNDAT
jgi:hypothetical protein